MKYKKQNKVFKNLALIILVIFFIVLLKIFLPSFKHIDYRDSVSLSKDEIGINMQLDYISMKNPPLYQNDEIYLPIDFVKDYIDKYIYWDKKENQITITNEYNVIRMKTNELEYFVNNEPLKLNLPIYNIENVAYIPKSFLQDFYELQFQYIEHTKILNIIKEDYKKATLSKNTRIRKEADKKSPYIKKIKKGETVYFYENEQNGYTKVVNDDGYIGFVPTKLLINIENKTVENNYENDYVAKAPWKVDNGKINLVFDQVQNVLANSSQAKRTYHDGVDVLVPTWFSFKDEKGEIINIADKGYVDWAHKNGYKVWGLLTDNFDKKISHSVLSSTKIREYVIKQLLAYVAMYDLDGINIDFESIPKEDGDNFVQFLRELAPLLRAEGAVLSVDLFVPKPWTKHYNRNEVGKIADYVIVMGYDEHYAGSESAGSVASMNWSDIAIKDTLAEGVPKEKLILGIPFYCRIWTENLQNNKVKLTSKAYSMNKAYNFIEEKGGTFIFDEKTGQNYGEVKEGSKTYKVWLEDETSITQRLNLVLKYDIAGAGAWKRGLEKEEIWKILKDKLKG
ncbi:glycosyl hydrolase family 18 protein [[Clostridium] colinum]|uniref:glycosyl hydrolase family 18 protein n=1 Tax=[Clostridium] colinum TaxID=36835 RepID=UPI0020258ECA|nr:glycosyl hydrolase family 18 protein [[Clostridium] colinum]